MTEQRLMAIELLKGGYDLHTHSSPSHISRKLDDFELLEQADRVGMAGIMIKNHYESTVGRAELVNKRGGLTAHAYGGIALNWPVGGINPYAVESALKMGAKFVWLPTRDAAGCLSFGDMPGDFFKRPGIRILNDEGRLIPQIYEILEIVKNYDAVFATGHVSLQEAIAACRAARQMDVKTVLTHPEWKRTAIPGDLQAVLAKTGVCIEKNWANLEDHECKAEEMVENIRMSGCDHVFLATDRGQVGKETPLEGMLRFIEFLLTSGFTESEIKMMVRTVPESLVH